MRRTGMTIAAAMLIAALCAPALSQRVTERFSVIGSKRHPHFEAIDLDRRVLLDGIGAQFLL